MNYIIEAEKILKDHKKLLDSLRNLEARKNKIIKKGVPKDIIGISYDKPSIQHQSYSEDTINQICEITEIDADIQETEAEIQIVTDILEQIKKENPILEKFIQLRYLSSDKKSLRNVATELGYSEDSNHAIYEIKNKSLREFAILYFGARAQKNT